MSAPTVVAPFALAASARTAAEMVDAIAELEKQKSQACAAQASLAAQLDVLVRAEHRDLRLPPAEHGRGVANQVALARRESPARGRRFLGLAHALTDELPCTLAAMEAGALSEWRATLIARETACLSRADRAQVDVLICAPDLSGRYPFDGWGDGRLVAELRKQVVRIDPQAVVDRRARAQADRRVSVRPAPDTMSQLSALLPAAQGVAVLATLTRVADQLVAAGDDRCRSQIMADTLVERITGQATADAVPVMVDLVVSDQTLLAGGSEPAWLHGFGSLTADAARDLVLQAHRLAIAELRRLYAVPETGALVSMDSQARFFPAGLATFLELRDRTCRTPWCDAPVRQRDHVVPDTADGETSALNGQGLCQQCNLAKQGVGWRSRPITGPPGALHTVETTLPTGHTYRSVAPTAPTPSDLRPRSDLEWQVRELLLAS